MLAYGKNLPGDNEFSDFCPEKIKYYREKNLPKFLKNLHSHRGANKSILSCPPGECWGRVPLHGAENEKPAARREAEVQPPQERWLSRMCIIHSSSFPWIEYAAVNTM